MASNYTTNYGLCQWEPGDNFVRTEFNQDNAKINAALAALGRGQQLWTTTVGSTNSISVPTDTVNWADWTCLALFLDIPANSISQDKPFSCQLMGSSGVLPCHSTAGSSTFSIFGPKPILIVVFPLHDPEGPVRGCFIGTHCGVSIGECTYAQIERFLFQGSTPYPSGTSATLWGIR